VEWITIGKEVIPGFLVEVRKSFTCRCETHKLHVSRRSLGGRIEESQGVEFVSEELDPYWLGFGWWPEIEDPASAAELSGFSN